MERLNALFPILLKLKKMFQKLSFVILIKGILREKCFRIGGIGEHEHVKCFNAFTRLFLLYNGHIFIERLCPELKPFEGIFV